MIETYIFDLLIIFGNDFLLLLNFYFNLKKIILDRQKFEVNSRRGKKSLTHR